MIMENLKSWGMLLLFISSGCLIYYFLLPSGGVSKTARSVLGITVMSLVCLPLFSVTDYLENMDFSFSEPPDMVTPDIFLVKSCENEINAVIDETVKKFTDISYKTVISIDITDDNSINIEHIKVVFKERPDKLREIKEALYEKLSVMPDTEVERENE